MKTKIVTVYFRTNSDNNRMCGYKDYPDEFQIFVCHIRAFLFYRFYKDITIYLGMCFLFALYTIHSPAAAK